MKKLPALSAVFVFLMLASFWLPALDAQHVRELTPRAFEDPLDFLRRFPKSFEAWLFYALYLAAVAGAIASWLWKWSRGQADGMKHWSFKYVVQQLLWFAGQAIAAIMLVGFVTESNEFFGWLSVLYTGGVTGFGGEVKTAWTDQMRAEKGGS